MREQLVLKLVHPGGLCGLLLQFWLGNALHLLLMESAIILMLIIWVLIVGLLLRCRHLLEGGSASGPELVLLDMHCVALLCRLLGVLLALGLVFGCMSTEKLHLVLGHLLLLQVVVVLLLVGGGIVFSASLCRLVCLLVWFVHSFRSVRLKFLNDRICT